MRFARHITIVAVTLCAVQAAPGRAAVYEVGEDGALIRLDTPVVAPLAAPVAARPSRPNASFSRRAEVYRPAINAAAERYEVSPALVSAIAHAESRFNPTAVSSAGARGIMQLMPATARQLGVDPADATANIRGGTAYLRYLLNRYDGDIVCTIAAYNAGPGNVRKSRCVPGFRETRLYVARVLDLLASAAN
jgi:soluble lytic murein transglycosylase-like protein